MMKKHLVALFFALLGAGGAFVVVQYMGGDRKFSADVNITSAIFALLVGALFYYEACRLMKKKG